MSDANATTATFVICEDDDDDFLILETILKRVDFQNVRVVRVTDGELLIDFLQRYPDAEKSTKQLVILLDLNMPQKDGREVLKEIKTHPEWKQIPVIVLTTSRAQEDVQQCYDLGANAYIVKPASFGEFEEVMRSIFLHWFKNVKLPIFDFVRTVL